MAVRLLSARGVQCSGRSEKRLQEGSDRLPQGCHTDALAPSIPERRRRCPRGIIEMLTPRTHRTIDTPQRRRMEMPPWSPLWRLCGAEALEYPPIDREAVANGFDGS